MSITEDFFETINNYRVFISELTLAEIENTPDATLGDKMRERVREFEIVELGEDVELLAQAYVENGAIGSAYAEDAYHIAAAVANGILTLLSWNFRHIVRRKTRDVVNMVNTLRGRDHIEILAPGELL